MKSFNEFASDKQIINLLVKERVKIALKNKYSNISPTTIIDKYESGEELSISEQIFTMMPPRDSWVRPRRRERLVKDSTESKNKKQTLTHSIILTIKHNRKEQGKYPYLDRLDAFIEEIQRDINSDKELSFSSLRIFGKPKKRDQDGTIILRPLCAFCSLREKVLIALANSYLSQLFDPLLHQEILSYRPPRHYHNSKKKVLTTRENAIENILSYRMRYAQAGIYVAECDIQKYFDTINHDLIRRYFREFAEKIAACNDEFNYRSVERIIDAYLRSYSFYNNVLSENKHLIHSTPPRKYESPKSELFVERNCYSNEEFEKSRSEIGIPQGGALSGLISNVILSSVDMQSVLREEDPHLFFCRYGDDILLMHTSKARCTELIERYRDTLTENKLLYHEFVNVSDEAFMRKDGTTLHSLWEQKSRKPFLWGRCANERDAIDWIGFLGYEIRYTGEVRLRLSSLNDKFKLIKRKYNRAAKTKLAKGDPSDKERRNITNAINSKIDLFQNDGFVRAKSLNRNKYSITQALKLNRYIGKTLYRLLYKIAKRNNLTYKQREAFWQYAKDSKCMNYLRTIK